MDKFPVTKLVLLIESMGEGPAEQIMNYSYTS